MSVNTCYLLGYCYLCSADVCVGCCQMSLFTQMEQTEGFFQCFFIWKNCWMNQYINLWLSKTQDKQIKHTSHDMLCDALPWLEEKYSHCITIYFGIRFSIVTIVGKFTGCSTESESYRLRKSWYINLVCTTLDNTWGSWESHMNRARLCSLPSLELCNFFLLQLFPHTLNPSMMQNFLNQALEINIMYKLV
jgi:hypothetical protein